MGRRLALVGLACAAALPGCGGGGAAAASGDAQLTGCVSRFNAERAGELGRHAFVVHRSQEALVTLLEHDGAQACAVIFAIPERDAEYGTLGEVATLRGWLPMQLADPDPEALQRRGTSEANALVRSDGTVTLR